MLRSMTSTPDSHDDHLRNLLDQRTARADLHGRFSSISEFSDTPSVYSRAVFSPIAPIKSDIDLADDLAFKSPFPHNSAPEVRSNHDRLNDPAASILDFDDDPRASFASSDICENEDHDIADEDDEPMPRMSLLGPKMRFHSRAPWEIDQDPLQEGDESDNSTNHPTAVSSTRGRIKDSVVKMGLGFGQSSPRSSSAGRPSGESSRSWAKSKTSFDTTPSHPLNVRGALHALGQANISSTSLIPPPSPGQTSLRNKFSMGHVRPSSPNINRASSPFPSPPAVRSASHSYSSNASPSTHVVRETPRLRVDSSQAIPHFDTHSLSTGRSSPYSDENIHPYAHPDLVISYTQDSSSGSPLHSTFSSPGVSRSDSSTTVTDSTTTSSPSRSGARSVMMPDTSAASITREQSSQNLVSSYQGREISSPIPVHTGTLPSLSSVNDYHETKVTSPLSPKPHVSSLPGWTERGVSPSFTLISLEEARAQRSRGNISGSSSSVKAVPFPEPGQDLGSTNSGPFRARARSISTGARAKHALHTIVGGPSPKAEKRDSDSSSVPPQLFSHGGVHGKVLKHKKSGLMRLFNGREKEDSVPPPVPTLSDAHAIYGGHKPVKITQTVTTHRFPASSVPPSMVNNRSFSQAGDPPEVFPSDSSGGTRASQSASSHKRNLPLLSIKTLSHAQVPRAPVSAIEDISCQTRTAPSSVSDEEWGRNDVTAQSAPPNVSEFPALKLRPVSTMFSSHFQDHIVMEDLDNTSLDLDLDTSSSQSPGTTKSPITPSLFVRSERSSSDKASMPSDDQSLIIRALQDQMVSAKMAWQQHIWELEGQVRDLKAEVDDLRIAGLEKDYCEVCGRGKQTISDPYQNRDGVQETKKTGVVNRPRARTGTSSRFGSGM